MKWIIGVILAIHLTVAQSELPACADQLFVFTVDNVVKHLFIDGVEVTGLLNAENWPSADKATVPAKAKTIAIKGVDLGQIAGILGSGDNFVTDGSWKCTNKHVEGWHGVDFDDSEWPAATVIGQHGVGPWGKIADIRDDAKWIWTSAYKEAPGYDTEVYCRAKTGACDRCRDVGTGPRCIRSCSGKRNGDHQSCKGCNVYATCSNGILYDNRPCPAGLVWDNNVKRCEYSSPTCSVCVN